MDMGAETMKFEPDLSVGNRNRITSYGPGYVIVAGQRHEQNLVLSAEQIVTGWGPTSADGFTLDHMQTLAQMAPEIVLVGTGSRLVFPAREIMDSLPRRGIGLEFMDTGAACRAYNFLLGEDRRVIAALLLV